MRDLRDPEKLGRLLISISKVANMSVRQAADELTAYHVSDYDHNPSCIEKYGRPGEHEPYWERIQIR